jgi:hypothetical protein
MVVGEAWTLVLYLLFALGGLPLKEDVLPHYVRGLGGLGFVMIALFGQ